MAVAALGIVLMGLGPASAPAWSPDGRWLAYVEEAGPSPNALAPGWLFRPFDAPSANDRIDPAPADRPSGPFRLWATRPDSGESVLLDESRFPMTPPAWSRDGTALAFGRIARGEGRTFRFEVVVQDAPDRKRILHSEPIPGDPGPSDRLAGLAPAFSPDGRSLAVPMLSPSPGFAIFRREGGRPVKTIDRGMKPCWSPEDGKLAFFRGGAEPGVFVLEGPFGDPRKLAELAADSVEALPGPWWSRDGQAVLFLRRAPAAARAEVRKDGLILSRIRVENGQIESTVEMTHDEIPTDRPLLGAWLGLDPDGENLFLSSAVPGQVTYQITWCAGKPDEVRKRFNPFDPSATAGALAAWPSGRGLALRISAGGGWSPPAFCEPETERLTPLAPDAASRAAWRGLVLAEVAGLLRRVPPARTDDGQSVERASRLPVPGEIDPGDPLMLRLRRLARIGLPLVDPGSPDGDEARLLLAYLADDASAALSALNALDARAANADQRARLIAVRAQVLLAKRDFDRAGALIGHLAKGSGRPSLEIVETRNGPGSNRWRTRRRPGPGSFARSWKRSRRPPTRR